MDSATDQTDHPDPRAAAPLWPRLLLAIFPLATGAAVLVTIVWVHDSLLWPSLALLVGTGATAWVVARRLPARTRQAIGSTVRLGLLAGVAATVAYDIVRYGLVALLGWSVDPFKTFPLFGQLLIGADQPALALWIAGTLFHAANGLGFAVGYAIVFRRPGVVSAVVWAMVLETFTILLYPDWLGLTAVGEFFSMSMIGHLAYGVVLGVVMMRATGQRGAGGTDS